LPLGEPNRRFETTARLFLVDNSIALGLEIDSGEGGQAQRDRVRAVVERDRLATHAAGIADVSPFVIARIRVQDLMIEAWGRDADSVVLPDNGREIAHGDDEVFGILSSPKEGGDARGGVIRLEPLKAGSIEIHFIERPLFRVQAI
jgi:hypothetical protein